ncbi:MAG: hypothetical protein ABIP03_13700 [Aquihabitans sp.]
MRFVVPSDQVAKPGRMYRDAGLMGVAWLVPLMATLAVTPTLVDRLGATEFGLFGTVSGLVIGVAAIGLSRPLLLSLASGHSDDASRSIVWGLASAGVGGAFILLVAVAVPTGWLDHTGVSTGQIRAALAAGAFAAVGTSLFSTMAGSASGRSRFSLLTVVTASVGTVSSIGYLWLAVDGRGAVAFLVWLAIVTTIGAAVYAASDRRWPTASLVTKPVGPAPAARLLPFVVVQLAGNTALILERAALAVVAGFASITVYVIPQTFVLTLHSGMHWITTPLVTRASQRYGQGDNDAVFTLYRRASRMAAMAAALGGATLVVLGRPLLQAWLPDQAVIDLGPFLLIVAYATALPMSVTAWGIAESTGHAALNAWVSIWWLAAVVVGAVLTPWLGIAGTTGGRAFLALTVPVYVAVFERRALGGATAWGLGWTSRLVVAAVLGAAMEYAVWALLDRSLVGIGVAAVGGTVTFVSISGWRRSKSLFLGVGTTHPPA